MAGSQDQKMEMELAPQGSVIDIFSPQRETPGCPTSPQRSPSYRLLPIIFECNCVDFEGKGFFLFLYVYGMLHAEAVEKVGFNSASFFAFRRILGSPQCHKHQILPSRDIHTSAAPVAATSAAPAYSPASIPMCPNACPAHSCILYP